MVLVSVLFVDRDHEVVDQEREREGAGGLRERVGPQFQFKASLFDIVDWAVEGNIADAVDYDEEDEQDDGYGSVLVDF